MKGIRLLGGVAGTVPLSYMLSGDMVYFNPHDFGDTVHSSRGAVTSRCMFLGYHYFKLQAFKDAYQSKIACRGGDMVGFKVGESCFKEGRAARLESNVLYF